MFSDLESDDLPERPNFNTTPSALKEDLLLASGGIVPAPIAQWLRHYQVEGVQFMYRLWKEGRGGILGDDMGLGSPSCFQTMIDRRDCPSYSIFNRCVWETRERERQETHALG